MNLPERIRHVRVELLKESGEEFAARFGVSRMAVNLWERGKRTPRRPFLEKLYRLFQEHGLDVEPVTKPTKRKFAFLPRTREEVWREVVLKKTYSRERLEREPEWRAAVIDRYLKVRRKVRV